MASLNFAIKSVSDMAFVDNKDNIIKEKALIQLFKNMSNNVGDCFKRWRDVNAIEKLNERKKLFSPIKRLIGVFFKSASS